MNIRDSFPILNRKINGHNLIYFDSAATSQKPISVINTITDYYTNLNANVRRGIYELSENASKLYENARHNLANFINARSDELIFTGGTTEGVNFIAQAWGMQNIQLGDEIVVTELEHHSNFLPWQRLAERTGAIFKVAPVLCDGTIDYKSFAQIVTPKTRLIAVTCQSNVTGIKTDIAYIANLAKIVGAKLFLDAAQIVAHERIDVKKLECDFLAFSGHKMFGPTGIGCLYIKRETQEFVEPYQVGGGMVFEVGNLSSTYLEAPYKFEAGTPKISEALGLSAAVDFIEGLPKYDLSPLSKYLVSELQKLESVRIIGPADVVAGGNIVSFVHDKIHAHDLAAYFDQFGICVRAGNHCAQPLHKKLNINSSLRVSFAVYNTIQEVELFVEVLKKIV